MKSLRDYLEESQHAADNPVAGDTFAINIREECLIESVVVESRSDGVVIAADDHMMRLLESYGYTFEQTCMECGGSGCGCGQAPEEYGDETNAGQNPGEYDQEGDMAKDELLTVIRSARRLIGMLDNDDNMPEWTQKKITKATDYVDTAADYISSQKERGVMEGDSEPSPVARATLHRIMMRHPGMLAQHGPERVMKAVDDVADLVGDMDDIGSSDISGWVNMVQEILDSLDQGVAEGAEQLHPETLELIDEYISKIEPDADRDEMIQSVINGTIHTSELEYALQDDVTEAEVNTGRMNQQHKDFYKQNPHFKRNDREMKSVGNRLATRVDPANPQQVRKKPATPFGMTEGDGDAESLRQKLGNIIKRVIASVDEEYLYSQSNMYQKLWGIYAGDIDEIINQRSIADLEKLAGELVDLGKSKVSEAEYQGRKVQLGKKMKGDVKKSKVYVKNPQGNVVKVNFGDPNMKIRKSNPGARKSFRARHNCDNPGPRHKARYWSCRAW
jgi:hypothetical protein